MRGCAPSSSWTTTTASAIARGGCSRPRAGRSSARPCDASEALRAAAELKPEVVLLDVHLPDVSGLYLAQALSGDAAVVLTSSRDASDFADRLSGSGACGFVPKAELSGDALDALLP